jgi:predicted DNA-binding transcriptional regulator AlpA
MSKHAADPDQSGRREPAPLALSLDISEQMRDYIRAELRAILPSVFSEFARTAIEDDGYLDTREAARLTGLSRQFFECGRSAGSPNQPRHYKIGRRVLYRRSEIIEWVRRRAET